MVKSFSRGQLGVTVAFAKLVNNDQLSDGLIAVMLDRWPTLAKNTLRPKEKKAEYIERLFRSVLIDGLF